MNGKFNNRRPNNQEREKTGLTVEVRNGDVSKALRIFKKKVQESGIIQEYKERQHYEKPSLVRKRKKAAAKARWAKQRKKLELEYGPPHAKRK